MMELAVNGSSGSAGRDFSVGLMENKEEYGLNMVEN